MTELEIGDPVVLSQKMDETARIIVSKCQKTEELKKLVERYNKAKTLNESLEAMNDMLTYYLNTIPDAGE